MKRAKRALVMLILCAALLLSGCQSSSRHDAARQSVELPTTDTPAEVIEKDPSAATDAPEKEKTKITIAGVDCAQSKIMMVINEFNKVSEDYTVSLIDYGYDGSIEQGKIRLQTQILAGNSPDMMLFENIYLKDYLSPLPYISAGLLMDLDAFVQNDPELSQEDFIIDKVLHEFGGMYVIGPKFSMNAVYTLPETAKKYAHWTLEDYIKIQNSLGPEQDMLYAVTPESFLRMVGRNYIHEAIDVNNATCDFDNPTFISLLETASEVKTCDTEARHVQADGSFKQAQEMMVDGELMFSGAELRSAADVGFDRYCAAGPRPYNPETDNWKGESGERLAYMGLPTPDGSNGVEVMLYTPVGICTGTEHADGCWEFIKFMLQNPIYQTYFDGTPVLASLLPENLEFVIKDSEQCRWVTDQTDQDVLVALARTCEIMSFYDEDVLTIISEEGAGVISGQITAEQAAARIQNRANVLVMERYG